MEEHGAHASSFPLCWLSRRAQIETAHAAEVGTNRAILGVKQRGGIVILIAHRPSALAAVDQVLVMADGRPQAFGPKDEVLKRVLRPPVWPLKVAAQN